MILRRGLGVLVLGALVALGVPACSSGGGRLTVYSGRTADLIDPLLERFSEETGIKIDVRHGDSAELALLINTEGDRSPADVFISQSPGAVAYLDGKNRLGELADDVVAAVPVDDRADDGSWVGLSGRIRVLVYNTELVDEADLPGSVLDLVDPKYDGMIGVAPPNGSFQDFVTAMRAERGDDATEAWLKGLAANHAKTYPNNVSIVEAAGRGEISVGLVNHYYNERAKAEDPDVPTENHFFDQGDIGSLLLVTAASIIESTDKQSDAERLVRFLLSEEAQEYFSTETFEYPLAAGVQPLPSLPAFSTLPVTRIDLDSLGGIERTEELIDRSGLAD